MAFIKALRITCCGATLVLQCSRWRESRQVTVECKKRLRKGNAGSPGIARPNNEEQQCLSHTQQQSQRGKNPGRP
jgi:hypothetical protein